MGEREGWLQYAHETCVGRPPSAREPKQRVEDVVEQMYHEVERITGHDITR